MTSLLHLAMIAHQTNMPFNLLDYVKPKKEAKSAAEGQPSL